MTKCENCGFEWSWWTCVKKSIRLTRAMQCPNCRKKQYQSTSSMRRTSLITMIPVLIIPITVLFNIPLIYAALLALVLFFSAIGISPMTLSLSNEEEPLW
ncbi:hypothetical protein H0266_02660 [Halobacillus locisalis]|uniref:Cxxc_20_cxxc protein n=1 Tax=Halobacillus locisalis TaxID=220753 RepID=A0A838CNQ6_9BACI|nr:TIGR04104 family putative zinc finger protein [Halobacillus locisalis]MBA2173792.1 hypothetical protein [Halobacillus locisalis]